MPKLKQNQFYCVKCRKAVTLKPQDICVVKLRNKKRVGGFMHATRGECGRCGTRVHKFITVASVKATENKYGKC